MSETILITGASGLVGKQLLKHLQQDTRHAVTASDLHLPASDEQLSGVNYISLNVCDAHNIEAAFQALKPTVVIHLASIVTPGAGDTRALAYQVDVQGSQHIVDACLRHQVRRLVVTSSGAAYGYHADNPVPLQEHHPLRGNPAFAYADHKRQVEELLASTRAQHPQLEQLVLRVGTVLGQDVDNQITALFHKKRLLAVSGYDSPFVFIWDEDLAAILARSVSDAPAGIYNVCGDGHMSIDQIAATLGKSTRKLPAALLLLALRIGSALGISRYGPEQLVFLQYRPVLDNQRLKSDFGYTPKYNSEQALQRWAQHLGLIS